MKLSVLIAESNLANASRVADRSMRSTAARSSIMGDPRKVVENHEVMNIIRG